MQKNSEAKKKKKPRGGQPTRKKSSVVSCVQFSIIKETLYIKSIAVVLKGRRGGFKAYLLYNY